MSKYLALFCLLALRIFYNPSYNESKKQPGYNNPAFGTSLAQPIRQAAFSEDINDRFYEKLGNQIALTSIKFMDRKNEARYYPKS